MKIVKRKIKDLIRAEYNPRKITKVQEQDLKDSLTRFGLVDPILVNINTERKNIIIGGHQRVKVWEKMGNIEVDCIELNLTYDKERELNVRLNKNTGGWDEDILQDLFEFDNLVEWGFTPDELFIDPDNLDDTFNLPDGDKEPFQQQTYTLADEQAEQIKNAIADVKKTEEFNHVETFGNENSNGNALYLITMQWVEQKK